MVSPNFGLVQSHDNTPFATGQRVVNTRPGLC